MDYTELHRNDRYWTETSLHANDETVVDGKGRRLGFFLDKFTLDEKQNCRYHDGHGLIQIRNAPVAESRIALTKAGAHWLQETFCPSMVLMLAITASSSGPTRQSSQARCSGDSCSRRFRTGLADAVHREAKIGS